MSEAITRSAKLIPYVRRPRSGSGFVTSFIFEAPPGDADDLGNLFVCAEVLTPSKQAEEVIDLIIHTLGDTYYNQPAHKENSNRPQRELRFEAGLKAVNRELRHYTSSGHAGWVGKLSAVLAVVSGTDLQLSNCGSAVGYLVRGAKARSITEPVDPNEPSDEEQQTFGNLVAARLREGDKLVMGTPALMHFFSDAQLAQLVSDHQPSLTVHNFRETAKGQNQADRLAAVVVEITSAERVADEQLPGVTSEASLGIEPTIVEQASATVTPIVHKAHGAAKSVSRSTEDVFRKKVLPALRTGALLCIQWLRERLKYRSGQIAALILVFVVLITTIFGAYSLVQNQAFGKFQKQYSDSAAKEQRAEAQLNVGDKTGARLNLMQAKTTLETLSADKHAAGYASRIAKLPRPEGVAPTIAALITYISSKIDTIDGLVKVNPTKVIGFDSLGAKPTLFEIVGTKGVFFDQQTDSITLYDFPTNKLAAAAANKSVGNVVAISTSSANDGIFLLTDKPSVWLYSIADNTFTEQSLGLGDWPKGRAIASYNSNLYILAADSSQIYKFGRTLTGFTGKSSYLPSSETTNLTGAQAIAVDGNVYTAGTAGLKRFLAGKLTAGASDLPGSLGNAQRLRLTADGTVLLTVDATTSRIGEIVYDGQNLHYKQQFQPIGIKDVADIVPDTRSKNVYILGDGALYRITPNY